MTATELGKEFALGALAGRRVRFADVKLPPNESLPAGSPMYFRCRACGATLTEPEGYVSRQKVCDECQALIDLGWME
jgi:hypothetical protein